MIARIWRGRATAANAQHYRRHATEQVFPSLEQLQGYQGACLLARETGGEVEFLALTLWDNVDVIKQFSGDDPEMAVVEPEARAVLASFDDFAGHYEVVGGSAKFAQRLAATARDSNV